MSTGPLSGLRACTESGTKGSDKHIHQYGACQGAQQLEGDRRMEGITSHWNITQHLSAAHGFVSSSLTRSNQPGPYFSHSKCARKNSTITSENVPRIGYLQRRLNIIMAGIHIQSDGTVRDSSGNIIQFRYGDDGFDPRYHEYLPLVFFTPEPKADKLLRRKRLELLKQMATLYRETELEPRSLVSPIEMQRMMAKTVYNFKIKYVNATVKPVALTGKEVNRMRKQWFVNLRKHMSIVFNDNLLLQVVLHDALTAYHIAEHLRLDGATLTALFDEMEFYLRRGAACTGEMVGLIAGQSTGT